MKKNDDTCNTDDGGETRVPSDGRNPIDPVVQGSAFASSRPPIDGAHLSAAISIATETGIAKSTRLANVLSLIDRRRYDTLVDFGSGEHDDPSLYDDLDEAVEDFHSAAVRLARTAPQACSLLATVKLKSGTSISAYWNAVEVASTIRPRRSRLCPHDAMLRGLMFPVLHFGFLALDAIPAHLDDRRDPDAERLTRLFMLSLASAGWSFSHIAIVENYAAVKAALHAQLTAEEGVNPIDDDPEFEIGDETDIEVRWLADGDYIDRGLFA